MNFIDALNKEDYIVIVEGKKDELTLRNLGYKGAIKKLNKSLFEIVEDVCSYDKKVVILTDLDKKGKYLYGVLKKDLTERGVKVDDKFREYLFKETKVRQIEGLKKEWLE